jgi:adenosine deaminase
LQASKESYPRWLLAVWTNITEQAQSADGLSRFFPLFSSYIYALINDLPSIQRSTASVLQDFQSDGVVYLELRTTPRVITASNLTKDDYVRSILEILERHNADPANTLRAYLILSVDRRNTPAEAEEVVDLALKYDSIVGVDLCGDPAKGDVRIFTPAFARAKAAGLKLTLHFAETEFSASDTELSTLLSWKPDRLGHVIHVKAQFREIIEKENIGVELCLSCNVCAKMIVGSYEAHHFGMWRHSSVPVAICVRTLAGSAGDDANSHKTDDVGVFCSPLSQEWELAAKHFGLDRAEVKALCERAVDSIFTGENEKARLRDIYTGWGGWTE